MPIKPTLSMTAMDWLLLIVLSVIWGGSFYFAKIAVPEIPPLTLALGRVGIAAAALAIFRAEMVAQDGEKPGRHIGARLE